MDSFLLVSTIALWAVALLLGFLLLGALRALGLLSWRLEQVEATAPSRVGRSGLNLGKKAPDFTLPSAANGDVALHDFAGRNVLLVLTQSGCGPCKAIIPELNRVQDQGRLQVLAINSGEPEATRRWAAEVGARFPVLAQEKLSLSKRYQVFVTPFAFLLDERGVITSKGIVGRREHLGYVLTGAGNRPPHGQEATEGTGHVEGDLISKEADHA